MGKASQNSGRTTYYSHILLFVSPYSEEHTPLLAIACHPVGMLTAIAAEKEESEAAPGTLQPRPFYLALWSKGKRLFKVVLMV